MDNRFRRTDKKEILLYSMWNSLPGDVMKTDNMDSFQRGQTAEWRTGPSLVTTHEDSRKLPIPEAVNL